MFILEPVQGKGKGAAAAGGKSECLAFHHVYSQLQGPLALAPR